MSPYPTVVSVTTAHHSPSYTEPKTSGCTPCSRWYMPNPAVITRMHVPANSAPASSIANRNARASLATALVRVGKLRRCNKEAKKAKGTKRPQIESRERPQRQDGQKIHDPDEAERVFLPVLCPADADAPLDRVEQPDCYAGPEKERCGIGHRVFGLSDLKQQIDADDGEDCAFGAF